MGKRKKRVIDYTKLSLEEVIKREIGRNVTFLELENDEQRRVLYYIREHKIDIKVFGLKWYDILTNKFFVTEYLPNLDTRFVVEKKIIEFDSFNDFFAYINGSIYDNCCFYGYVFSKDEVDKFFINLEALNFESFIAETIDDFTYESMTNIENESININKARKDAIIKWFKLSKPVITLKDLETKRRTFIKKFNFWKNQDVFFSMLLRRDKNIVKEAAIEYICKHDVDCGIGFGSILFTYGKEAALRVIDNFIGVGTKATQRKRIKYFKDSLECYDNGTLALQRKLGFDETLQFYYVYDWYCNNNISPLIKKEFFSTFLEFISFTKGDLSNADLSKAPLEINELKIYKTNENTKYPQSKCYDRYEIKKYFYEGIFFVKQDWINKDGNIVLKKEFKFNRFFDFAHFLKGDLSGADLLLCSGIENINKLKNINLNGVKVRSEVAQQLGLSLNFMPKNKLETKSFELTERYELETRESFEVNHHENHDYSRTVSYITDIHLLHRFQYFKCKTFDDMNYVSRVIAKTLGEQSTSINLIGGDTSSDFDTFKQFIRDLKIYSSNDFFFILGNHELWSFKGEKINSIIDKYKKVLEEDGDRRMHLIQNNIFYFSNYFWEEITEKELFQLSVDALREKMRGAKIIIFGGIGFAGMNNEFNANNGIYLNTLDRKSEIAESKKFFNLYEKVTSALKGKNLIIFTHMPLKDWAGADAHAKEGFVYVNGHSHHNYFFDDGKKRIYADNQVGYRGKMLGFKRVGIDCYYDWFADYKDGIYEITSNDYIKFYRGVNQGITFKRQYKKLFMIKREKTYMFLMQNVSGNLQILNGGVIKRAGNHSLDYFYENLVKYSTSVKQFLSKYDEFQKQVSKEVKLIGGDGTIHGCIVDIDFYNHLYLNPLDGKVTPYFADSMVSKYVYDNLPSLLKFNCPKLFANYEKLITLQNEGNALTIFRDQLKIKNNPVHVTSTAIYKVSRIIKGLQYTTKYNIVRIWNDSIVNDVSVENGKLIVSGIIESVATD